VRLVILVQLELELQELLVPPALLGLLVQLDLPDLLVLPELPVLQDLKGFKVYKALRDL
jgi:hypothetical protein